MSLFTKKPVEQPTADPRLIAQVNRYNELSNQLAITEAYYKHLSKAVREAQSLLSPKTKIAELRAAAGVALGDLHQKRLAVIAAMEALKG